MAIEWVHILYEIDTPLPMAIKGVYANIADANAEKERIEKQEADMIERKLLRPTMKSVLYIDTKRVHD